MARASYDAQKPDPLFRALLEHFQVKWIRFTVENAV